ncbi:MAG: lipoyl(octanoyl) transferase LipB [Chloroflexi bacterium]|nr:lipoyl(octanoyl) transferase LipB [Chloroflexota bacterium]
MKHCQVHTLGTIGYAEAWALQKQLAAQRAAGQIDDTLLLLEHPHTYTFGSRGRRAHEHLLVPRDELEAAGIAVLDVDRGGDVTYHGPGQIVGYPILRLAEYNLDAVEYMRSLESMLIAVCESYGLAAGRVRHLTGVWVGEQKLAAIGTKVDVNGVTLHGFALNVTTDLDYFTKIVPCGIRNKGVGSLAGLLGRDVPLDEVIDRVVAAFGQVFDVEMIVEQAPQAAPVELPA